MDRKQVTALVLLDLSKAFDSIDHMSLLKKLRAVGTSKEAIEWFRIASYCDTVLGKEFCPSFLCNSEMVDKYPAWRALFFLSANHLSLLLLTTGTQAMRVKEAKAFPEKSHVAIRHNTNLVSREILK